MADYIPNSNFYSDQIKEQKKIRKKFENASYSSEKRGYQIGGKVYSQSEINNAISEIDSKIASIEKEAKKYGPYGPEFGEGAQGNAAGVEYEKLRDEARAIEVTDYESAIANLQAWQKVKDFAASNKDIKIVQNVDAIVKNERGRSVRKSIKKVVPVDQNFDARNFTNAQDLALEYAEEGTTKVERVKTYDAGAASTYANRKTVTDESALNARLAEIDAIQGGTTVSTAVQTQARKGQPPKQTVAQTSNVGKKKTGGQSAMTEAETMAAYSGFQKMGRKPEQPEAPGGTGGGAGGGAAGGGLNPPARSSNWEAKFREMFPGQTWMLDIDRTKYPDVFKIFQDAVTNRAWESEAGALRFKTQLDNSSFIKELKSTNKVAQIKSLVGDLGFDSLPFNAFVTKAMNYGWDDVTLKQEAYKEVFRKDDAGNYANPLSVTRAKASNDYLRIANIGKAYFNNLSDDTIEKSLVGGLTTEDVERQQREVAKTKYSHLGNLIDQGVTLKELSSSFQTQAAQLLERDPNSIDMSTADFEQAFNFGEEGKKRMMTSGEWEIKLRSDPRFNWDKTQNAKQEAMNLASTIAQAFGKVI